MKDKASIKKEYDMILKGGRVIDPANDIDRILDIGIKDKKIAKVSSDIGPSSSELTIDAKGYCVVPGLIDIHTHLYTFPPGAGYYLQRVRCIDPDAHLPSSGVTTAVDAGTTGTIDFKDFKEKVIDKSQVRIFALLNIASTGMIDSRVGLDWLKSHPKGSFSVEKAFPGEQDPAMLDPEDAAEMVAAYPDTIVGIKSAHYWTSKPWDAGHPPWESVDRALKAGKLSGKPVMVDFWPRNPERPYRDLILKKLRPGDIHTHIFANQFPVMDSKEKVSSDLYRAREKGVLFDTGHGAGSFWFPNAYGAVGQGFYPDTVSTDLHMANINGPVIGLTNVMSKFLNMGMGLYDIVKATTIAPARIIGKSDLGTLSVGRLADIAVLKVKDGDFFFTDCKGAKMAGDRKIDCAVTIKDGKVIYDPSGLSLPYWKDAPASYWEVPKLQEGS